VHNTGNCSAVGDLYRHNATLGDHRANLLWWRDGVSDADGVVFGAAPNVMYVRRPGQPQPLTSIMLVPPPQDGEELQLPALCATTAVTCSRMVAARGCEHHVAGVLAAAGIYGRQCFSPSNLFC
jgi:hypothetical protein